MKILLLGATGATGKHLLRILLERENEVKVIVRSADRLPSDLKDNRNLEVIEGTALDLKSEMHDIIKDCRAAASCLGHNLTFKGLFGKPRKLVRDSVKTICDTAEKSKHVKTFRFVLMNTTANRNKDLKENWSFAEKLVVGLLRSLLPPQSDNEKAADHLRRNIGNSNKALEWVAVRPDGLIDLDSVTDYEIYPSPVRSPIFNAGKTSRINVGHFMADLLTKNETFAKWKGQMPVIYNS